MDSFLSLIFFILPGLLTYFWIQFFGITPSSKQGSNELLGISALLWFPIVIVIMIIYNTFANLSHLEFLYPDRDIPLVKKDWIIFDQVSDFNNLTDNYWFLFYFIVLSIFISYYLAKLISGKLYKKLLDIINKNREENGLEPYSSKSTVWEETFIKNIGQIVSISNLDDPSIELYGEIKNVSRPLESEQSIVLINEYFWKPVFENYNVVVTKTYINSNAGIVIKIFDYDQAIEAGNMYLNEENITSS